MTLWTERNMFHLISDPPSADIIYHMMGGKANHTIVTYRKRIHGGVSADSKKYDVCSLEILAKDTYGVHHSMGIRFLNRLDDLKDIREHRLGGVWEETVDGKLLFCRPATHFVVYLTDDILPEGKMICKTGFLLAADDLPYHMEFPSLVISSATNDGSPLGEFVQYLVNPDPGEQRYGGLCEMVEIIRRVQSLYGDKYE